MFQEKVSFSIILKGLVEMEYQSALKSDIYVVSESCYS